MIGRPLTRPLLSGKVIAASDLAVHDRERWRSWVSSDASFAAPSFDPDFVCELARHVGDCRIGVLECDGEIAGYIPFARTSRGAGPIVMCDYQSIVLAPGLKADARDIVRALGLSSLTIECLPVRQFAISPAHQPVASSSPVVDVSAGYEAYSAQLEAIGVSGKNVRSKLRRLERDHGALRLEHGDTSAEALSRLLRLKAVRFTRDGTFEPWVHRALEAFHGRQVGRMQGHMSILRAGASDVAYLFCLKREGLLYYWFPTFNPAFGRYSPGLVALQLLIRDLPAIGCTRLDLGPGGEAYKNSFANVQLPLASAHVHASATMAAARSITSTLRSRLSSSVAVRSIVNPLLRRLRPQS